MKYIILLLLLFFTKEVSSQGDCPGICTTSNGTFSAINGLTLELNTLNRGCLIAGEANSSYWLLFCFSTSGVFQFYIDPSGNRNDFDFAIWDGVNCAPTSTPIRCSYAAVPPGGPCATCDYTGLGNGATDISESASGNGYLAPLNVIAGQCIILNINNYGSGSNNFTLYLAGTTATLTCPTLNIELGQFTGIRTNDSNVLSWVTMSEFNNEYFILERSTDALNWLEVSKIKGAGTITTASFYTFKDFFFKENYINYYRLVSVDYNKSFYYSQIVAIENLLLTDITTEGYFSLDGKKIDFESAPAGLYIYKHGVTFKKILKLN